MKRDAARIAVRAERRALPSIDPSGCDTPGANAFAAIAAAATDDMDAAGSRACADLQLALLLSRAALQAVQSESPELRWLGERFATYVHCGGDLALHLGVRIRRGGAHSAPHMVLRRYWLRERFEAMAADAGPSMSARVAAVKRGLDEDGPHVRVLRSMGITPPTSDAQIIRIFRGQ